MHKNQYKQATVYIHCSQMTERQNVTKPRPQTPSHFASSSTVPHPYPPPSPTSLQLYNKQLPMLQATQQSLVKIDALISGIRMINLHVYNYLIDHSNPRSKDKQLKQAKQPQEEFRKLNMAHFQQHIKFISQYLKKCLKDMAKTRVSLSPLVYRPIRARVISDQDFLRFQNVNYGVKFLFTDLLKECLMNIEIYRKANGTKIGGTAMRKLQMTFLYDIFVRYPECLITVQMLQAQGKAILQQVTTIFSGEKCANCNRHLVLNNQVMAFLPPTVRESSEQRESRFGKKYYHQSCL